MWANERKKREIKNPWNFKLQTNSSTRLPRPSVSSSNSTHHHRERIIASLVISCWVQIFDFRESSARRERSRELSKKKQLHQIEGRKRENTTRFTYNYDVFFIAFTSTYYQRLVSANDFYLASEIIEQNTQKNSSKDTSKTEERARERESNETCWFMIWCMNQNFLALNSRLRLRSSKGML